MKASLVLLLVAFLAVCYASPASISSSEKMYRTEFISWMRKFGKTYSSEEFQQRYTIFKANMDFVNSWDESVKGFQVELNGFADLSLEEFTSTYMGLKVNVQEKRRIGFNTPFVPALGVNIPTSVDWRTQGYVTGIKDQGQCGSCWSFSTTGSSEGAHFKSTKNLVSLSEQQLVDCSTSFGNQGCNGGLMDQAFQYIIKNGIVSEASYPYTAQQGTCNLQGKKTVATLTTYKDIAHGSEPALTSAISTVGPISVAIDASHSSFQLYKSGVYFESACSATQLDHGVLAVGYGVDGASDYYIVKNSWGTTWGMAGYINMSRNKNNNCGIATMASYPIA